MIPKFLMQFEINNSFHLLKFRTIQFPIKSSINNTNNNLFPENMIQLMSSFGYFDVVCVICEL